MVIITLYGFEHHGERYEITVTDLSQGVILNQYKGSKNKYVIATEN